MLGDCLLKNPHPSLEVINLRGIKISDDESLKFGLGLAGYKVFSKISFFCNGKLISQILSTFSLAWMSRVAV